jgi:hypothetical protein
MNNPRRSSKTVKIKLTVNKIIILLLRPICSQRPGRLGKQWAVTACRHTRRLPPPYFRRRDASPVCAPRAVRLRFFHFGGSIIISRPALFLTEPLLYIIRTERCANAHYRRSWRSARRFYCTRCFVYDRRLNRCLSRFNRKAKIYLSINHDIFRVNVRVLRKKFLNIFLNFSNRLK